MSREEQIRKAAYSGKNNLHAQPHPVPGVAEMVNEYFALCFKEGAAWADSHPQWISVEEELPKEKGKYMFRLSNGDMCYETYYPKLKLVANVTHWMEIVPPRKEG